MRDSGIGNCIVQKEYYVMMLFVILIISKVS